jgi:hypothetical protein
MIPFALIVAYLIIRAEPLVHFATMFGWDNQAKNAQRDVRKMPDVDAVSEDVLELRRQHHLRPLTELENGKKARDLPNGIFGFSMCSVESLGSKRGDTFSLEIHKHQDGIVYYVGYASGEHIGKYLSRQKNFHILASPRAWEEASSLFEIPVDFVSKCEERPSRDGYLFDLFVTAIPELQS